MDRKFGRQTPAPEFDLQMLRKIMGSSLLWVAAALLVLVVMLLVSIRVGRVEGTQVGVLLDKWTGKMEVINQSGVRVYNGITSELYVLEKTLQSMKMIDNDSLKIKTIDGSDVYVDLNVQYRIEALKADEIIIVSGPGEAYKQKWARDYVRSLCRDALGELTTEEFYDATKRNDKIQKALREAQKRLLPFGILIDDIQMPRKPTFYAEYENLIKEKKLADQAVQKEHSKAKNALQDQKRIVVEETNNKNVAVRAFRGKMDQHIIKAEADARRIKEQADAYYDRVTIGAGAELYRMKKEATAVLTRKQAEAKGILALKKALEGEGGRNMVKLEYARKLKGLKITGKPFTISGRTERFEHLTPAASARRETKRKQSGGGDSR